MNLWKNLYADPKALNDIDRIISPVRPRFRKIEGVHICFDCCLIHMILHQLHPTPRSDVPAAVFYLEVFHLSFCPHPFDVMAIG